jgi:hypothetical protein
MSTRFDNFGELYRAAFAEDNPEIKQLLLADVKNVLDRWAESDHDTSLFSPISPQSSSKNNRSSLHRVA